MRRNLSRKSAPLNAAGMNTIVGYVYDMLYRDSGGYPSYASAAAIILFAIQYNQRPEGEKGVGDDSE